MSYYRFIAKTILGLVIASSAFATTVNTQTSSSTTQPTVLLIKPYTITVNGKIASVYHIVQPNGTWGYIGTAGDNFNVIVKNETTMPTTLHWHGLIVPNSQDGVPNVTQLPIPPGGEYHYDFKLLQSGTYWMHSHVGFQIQQMISAPLIILNPADNTKEKNVVMFLSDFSFKSPQTILNQLTKSNAADQPAAKSMKPMQMTQVKADLNDVQYDALLTNYHTLHTPEIIRVIPGQLVRLRIIDAAAMSSFFINTNKLPATAIAVDGEDIHPLKEDSFQLAAGQRLDLLVKIPAGEGAYPILAEKTGTSMQTGLILATAHTKIPKLSETATTPAGALNYQQEWQLKALHPLKVKPVQQILHVNLEGSMSPYQWKINNQMWPNITPLIVKQHDRVQIIFDNQTNMTHPMHLHGHVFEVTAIDGKPMTDGALRDTVFILPHSTLTVQFDANNPGNWMLHCHMVYHMAAGMLTLLSYEGYKLPKLLKKE